MFLAVCFLHFWKLDSAPKGFTPDEAAFAYNAFCIVRTGADEHGTRWPLFFGMFDTYTDPVAIYSAAVPVRAFGLHPWAARLPSALYYLMACVAFYMLLRQWRFGTWYALAGGFILSIIPWGFPMSRNGSFAGYSAEVLGLILVLVLTDSALRLRSYRWAVLAGVAWALAFYTQQSIRPVLALLVSGGGIVLWRPLVRRRRVIFMTTVSALIVLLPMIVNVWRFPEAFTARFRQVGIFSKAISLSDVTVGVASRYIDYFNPGFLFISGDSELRHHTGFGGELYWSLAPLIFVGLVVAIRFWRWEPRYRIVVVGLLASPVPAALTIDRMHGARDVNGLIFWLLLAAVGGRALWRHQRVGRRLLMAICAAGLVESATYFADYFGPYQMRCRETFQTSLTEALEYCFDHIATNQTLYVSGSVGTINCVSLDPDFKPYVYALLLFHGKIDPLSYQHSGFSNTIVRPYLEEIDQPGLLLRCNYTPAKAFTLEGRQIPAIPNFESIPDAAKLLAVFHDDPLVYQVWKVGTTPRIGVTRNNARIDPKHVGTFRYPEAETHCYWGGLLQRAGKIQDAIEQYEQAVRIWPDYAEAHCNLGVALERTGKVREGIGHYEQALRIKQDYPKVQNNLAWLLATHTDVSDPARAVTLADQACKLTDNRVASYLDTLAAAYAAAGQFNDAMAVAEKAIGLARSGGQPELAVHIETRLELYRSRHDYRQPVRETEPHNP